ncbi:MAG: arylamine N-acetyltransferase, partial [Zoogloeaceae bacterium]|nr:arylamine N-acetyltransferase [Zoogloeaceae bacterium]
MMKPSLPAYFSRIGFLGHARPDEATLINLHRLHAETIPFENLDVLLGRPIQLSTEALFDKLVASGRGGYCLEQNGLFAWVLQAIGFEIAPLTARVMLGEPEALTARTHSLLAVKIRHETWLADVGLGGKTLREPVRLAPHQAQETAGGVYRIEPHSAGDYTMEIQRANGAFAPLYRFDLRPSEPADFDMANFYLSHWEGSPFRRRLLVSRQLSTGGKLTLK